MQHSTCFFPQAKHIASFVVRPPEEEFTILAKQCKNGRFLTPDSSCVEREYCWPPHINRRYPKMGMVDKNRSEDGLIGGECAECPDVCNQCELLEKCTECRHSLYLTPDDQCKATCPATHYPNNPKENDKEADSSIGRECVLCEGNCSTCTTKTATWMQVAYWAGHRKRERERESERGRREVSRIKPHTLVRIESVMSCTYIYIYVYIYMYSLLVPCVTAVAFRTLHIHFHETDGQHTATACPCGDVKAMHMSGQHKPSYTKP